MCLAVCLQSIHYEREREKIANVIPFTTNIYMHRFTNQKDKRVGRIYVEINSANFYTIQI